MAPSEPTQRFLDLAQRFRLPLDEAHVDLPGDARLGSVLGFGGLVGLERVARADVVDPPPDREALLLEQARQEPVPHGRPAEGASEGAGPANASPAPHLVLAPTASGSSRRTCCAASKRAEMSSQFQTFHSASKKRAFSVWYCR
jgi:hypothetical protein